MRSLACFLLGIAGCLAATGVQAQRESIRSCLQGWELPPLKLPYFPRYWAPTCTRSDPPKDSAPRYFSGSSRSLKLELRADLTPMAEAIRHPVDPDTALGSSFRHFDTWLRTNGFQRIDATGNAPTPRNASYEAMRPHGKVRISLAWPTSERLVIEFEQVPGGVRGDVALRKPNAAFRFHDPLADLFKLPGAELISEDVRFRDQQIVPIDNPFVRGKFRSFDDGVQLFLPEKWLVYRFPKGVNPTEAELALREALKQAGWVLKPHGTGPAAYFPASGRQIDLEIRFYFDGYIGFDVAQVIVRDPLFQKQQAPVEASLESLGQYTFAPGLQPDGSLAEDSTLRLAAASYFMQSKHSRENKESKYAIEIAPIATEASSTERAKQMASKVKDELARRGWEASRIIIPPDSATPGPDAAGLAAGVRLSLYECRTRSTDRPGGAVLTCECSRERQPPITRPGACS